MARAERNGGDLGFEAELFKAGDKLRVNLEPPQSKHIALGVTSTPNLAKHLPMDAFDNAFDMADIVSNDSDLKEPIHLVRERFGKGIGILNPQAQVSRALQPLAHFIKPISPGALQDSQFPDQMADRVGAFQKPGRW